MRIDGLIGKIVTYQFTLTVLSALRRSGKCTWSGARILIKLQGSIPNQTSWMIYRLLVGLWMLLEEADLEHGFEHVVSSSYRANLGEFSVPLLTHPISILYTQVGGRD
ncbi:hypothetical protein Tco_1304175 [Tanacetum coccineum]